MKRAAIVLACALCVSALGSAVAPSPAGAAAPRTIEDLVKVLEAEAPKAGVSAQTVRRLLAGIEREPDVVARAAAQTEHERSPGQYVTMIVSADRIAMGQTRVAEHAATLAAVEARFGVDRYTLAAVWGVETRYGTALGTRHVMRSLATLALEDTRRAAYWRSELLQALRILERGDVAPVAMLGSWAGAVGHTQFMPSTYNRFAVDFDHDGKRDLWGSVPDALGSAANYLQHSGWQRGETWGFEVSVPAGFDYALANPSNLRPISRWAGKGVRLAGGGDLPASKLDHRLLLPEGAAGPAFLVNRNFAALLAYNPAMSYALAVALLGDRLAGKPGVTARWSSEEVLARFERRELQERLAARGFDVGGVDGIIGNLTRAAIRTYQKSQELVADGHPSVALLERLRAQDAAGAAAARATPALPGQPGTN